MKNIVLVGACYCLWLAILGFRQRSFSASNEPPLTNSIDTPSLNLLNTQGDLVNAQIRAAEAQVKAAEAQVTSARLLSRPVLLPALEYDQQRKHFDLILRNVGIGVAIRAAWSISPSHEATLNQFIWPRKAGLIALQYGTVLQAIAHDADWFTTVKQIPEGSYLVLVNYTDLAGNLWQTQFLSEVGREDAAGEQGFSAVLVADLIEHRATLGDPTDPMENGTHPWWNPKRSPPNRRRPYVVSETV